eukprot:gb/GECH01006508.1/.p1 GENE.gb/GECH01006508.1/~~gb/GECH01006508.1/.p1  ORF type:complete len:215 (+),score=48.11 gb/GECH01006508.1/:1-645(+)
MKTETAKIVEHVYPHPFTTYNNVSCRMKNGITEYLANEKINITMKHISESEITAKINGSILSGNEQTIKKAIFFSMSNIYLKDAEGYHLSHVQQLFSPHKKFGIFRDKHKLAVVTRKRLNFRGLKYYVKLENESQKLKINCAPNKDSFSICRGDQTCASYVDGKPCSLENLEYTLQVREGEDVILMLSIVAVIGKLKIRDMKKAQQSFVRIRPC